MARDANPEPLREAVDRALQPRVVERDQPPAPLAHQMMVMVTVRAHALKARLTVPHLDALHQPVLDQQLQYAIDAGPAGGTFLVAKRILDLHRAQRARLAGQHLNDPLASAASLQAGLREHQVHMLAPVGGLAGAHTDQD